MKASDFREWIGKITQLSRGQKEQAKHSLGGMAPRIEVAKWLESSFEPICPVCQSNHFYRWGYQAGLQRFCCRMCKHTFTAISGTPLARLRHKDQWLNYSAALIEGRTVRASGSWIDHRVNAVNKSICGVQENLSSPIAGLQAALGRENQFQLLMST